MRRLRRIILFLLLGAVVNVLVAWACAWRKDSLVFAKTSPSRETSWVPYEAREYLAQTEQDREPRPPHIAEFDVVTQFSLACTSKHYSRRQSPNFGGFRHTHSSHEFGLPLRSMRYAEQSWMCMAAFPEFASWRMPGWRGGWPIAPSIEQQDWASGSYVMPEYVYPLIPLSLGFAVNTMFYGSLAWFFLFGVTTLRRRRRIRRNLCLSCGYSLAGAVAVNNTITCPECGKPSACDGASP